MRIISNYMKLMSTKAGSLPFADKQTSMIFITNCVKLVTHTLHQGLGSVYRHKAPFSPTGR
jgi:hypothetical protein